MTSPLLRTPGARAGNSLGLPGGGAHMTCPVGLTGKGAHVLRAPCRGYDLHGPWGSLGLAGEELGMVGSGT